MKYASDYRNRPVLSVSDYDNNQRLNNKKGCTCRTNLFGLALIVGLTVGVGKCSYNLRQENKQYEMIIDEQRQALDSLNYEVNK